MFIPEQKIMAAYKIKETLKQQKPLLMRYIPLEESFEKAVTHSAASSLEQLLLEP